MTLFSLYPSVFRFSALHIYHFLIKDLSFWKVTFSLCSPNILYFDDSPWRVVLCILLSKHIYSSLENEIHLYPPLFLELFFLPPKQCCVNKGVNRVEAFSYLLEPPTCPYVSSKPTTEKLLPYTALLRKLWFPYAILLIIRIFLKVFSGNEFVLIQLKTNKQRKEGKGGKAGSQSASLWFSLRIHQTSPLGLIGPTSLRISQSLRKAPRYMLTSAVG